MIAALYVDMSVRLSPKSSRNLFTTSYIKLNPYVSSKVTIGKVLYQVKVFTVSSNSHSICGNVHWSVHNKFERGGQRVWG